jgi:hypothetical protein
VLEVAATAVRFPRTGEPTRRLDTMFGRREQRGRNRTDEAPTAPDLDNPHACPLPRQDPAYEKHLPGVAGDEVSTVSDRPHVDDDLVTDRQRVDR